jgi:ElaA protein
MVSFRRRAFDALTIRELHDLLALRSRVFVVEQACIYLDVDGRDPSAHHVLGFEAQRFEAQRFEAQRFEAQGFEDDLLVAYARVLPAGARFGMPAIGRVVVAPEARGRGLARTLMREAMDAARELHGEGPLALAAQAHLERFYASLGFARMGDEYDEDGIPHVDMRRR